MTKKNTLQLRRRPSKFSSYNDVVSAMTEVEIAEGELIAGFYEENGEDHAVLGLGGVGGAAKAFFSDGQGGGGADPEEITKIKEAVGYFEETIPGTGIVPKSTKLDPVPDSTEGNLPVLTDKGTLSASETVFVKDGELIQVKDDKTYPIAHPDISTQASILPERFGNMDIKEVLIPIEPPTTAQGIDTESLPFSAMPVMGSVFCGSAFFAATLIKGEGAWQLQAPSDSEPSWGDEDWWLLVRYVDQDEPVYYGPTFDEIDDTDDGQPVDLGLPSGTKWMKSNIGATKPSDLGLYFQWGDTQGYEDASEHQFSWDEYKWGTYDNLTKYNNTDGLITLEASDDSAVAATGGQASMPTKAQLEELRDNTEHRWLRLANGVNGMKFWKKDTEEPTDGNSYIFIPAAGYCDDGSHDDVGYWGCVWSASRDESNASSAWSMSFDADTGDVGMSYDYRCYGYSVRAVVSENI